MKIALVSPYDFSYPGGVNTHVSRLADRFIRQGHAVKVVAPCSRREVAAQHPNLIPVGRAVPVPSGQSIARIAVSLRAAPTVKRILAEEQFDVVHLHEPLVPILPITFLRLSTAANIGTFHAYHGTNRIYRYMRRVLRQWFRRLDGKIAVSRPAMEFISKYFPGDYDIIPNGIDAAHFSAPASPIEKYKDGKVNILFVGRMEKRKGLRYLLSAYARLKWETPQVRLIVVGPGRLDPESERLLGERPVADIEFVGGIPYGELPRYYQTADIFCAPATGMESFGIVLLEAMASGTAIVASNIPGYASVLPEGSAGALVPPKDEAALAAALEMLVRDEDLRKAMGAQGREMAQDYDWDKVSQRVLALYERVLTRKRPQFRATGG